MRKTLRALAVAASLTSCDRKDQARDAVSEAAAAVVEAAPPDPCTGADIDLFDATRNPACVAKSTDHVTPLSAAVTMKVTPTKPTVIGRLPVELAVEITNESDAVAALDLTQFAPTTSSGQRARAADAAASRELGGFTVALKGEDPIIQLTNGSAPWVHLRLAPRGRAHGRFSAPILVYRVVDQNLEQRGATPGVHDLVVAAPVAGDNHLTATTRITVESPL